MSISTQSTIVGLMTLLDPLEISPLRTAMLRVLNLLAEQPILRRLDLTYPERCLSVHVETNEGKCYTLFVSLAAVENPAANPVETSGQK